MITAALIVAGGAGTRMSKSGGDRPKPLMEVADVSLLEWNLGALLQHSIRAVYIAIASSSADLAEHIEQRCRPLAEHAGCSLHVIKEVSPLGSIGAAGLVRHDVDTLLVVNADNLTSIDLTDLLDAHREHRPAITLAVHDEPFHMPFGQVTVVGDAVSAYVEKPTLPITVSSAVTALGPQALALLEPYVHVMLPELVQRALDAGLPVRAFRHHAAWVDVNDLAALGHAEAALAADPTHFSRGTASAN